MNDSGGLSIRDALCNLRPVEIPRPRCVGFQFIPTRGRFGFYQSIKQNEAEKYGINIKSLMPKRPSLPSEWHKKINSNCIIEKSDEFCLSTNNSSTSSTSTFKSESTDKNNINQMDLNNNETYKINIKN